jgi:hypothetical protein
MWDTGEFQHVFRAIAEAETQEIETKGGGTGRRAALIYPGGGGMLARS